MQALEFAIFEFDLVESGFAQLDHAEVAVAEMAFGKRAARQVTVGKNAVVKVAVFVFSSGEWRFGVVLLGKFFTDRVCIHFFLLRS